MVFAQHTSMYPLLQTFKKIASRLYQMTLPALQDTPESFQALIWCHRKGGDSASQTTMSIFSHLPGIPAYTYPVSLALLVHPVCIGIKVAVGCGISDKTQSSQCG